VFQALCGVIVFNAGLWLGMRAGGPAGAGVFTSATPAVMAALGMLAFGERPNLKVLAGIGLSMTGVLATRDVQGLDWRPGPHDALLLAAVAGEAVFLLALKWLPEWLSPMAAAKRITWLGLAMVLPLAAAQSEGFDPAVAGLEAWLAVTGLMPVSAVLSSWLLLGQAPTAGQALGCLAVGAGIWLASRRR
jgi:drug/metabolite transporter (DMT)-like permease